MPIHKTEPRISISVNASTLLECTKVFSMRALVSPTPLVNQTAQAARVRKRRCSCNRERCRKHKNELYWKRAGREPSPKYGLANLILRLPATGD